ncbi:zinc-dependent metalloprotease [Psychrosphaera aestuarii]|uniref:zinc-dependent metalloprotease n=1 Tax=Psychrosphaera aestuarii TaxID=1266052 RepID=UPI001B31EDB6
MRMSRYLLSIITLFAFFMTSVTFAEIKSVKDFTSGMLKVEGYFTFFYDKKSDKIYLQIEEQKEPFLFQSSLPHGLGSNDIGLDRGQLGDTRVVQFESYGNKVLLTQLNTDYRANSDNRAEQKSVEEAFAKSVIFGFEIIAKDRGTSLIDYTPFLLSDIHGVARKLKAQKQGNYSVVKNRSAVNFARSKSFPKNTELESIVSFSGSSPGQYVRQVAPDAHNITVHMHHSLVKLPDDNYQARAFHPFSGYWSISHKDYAASLDNSMNVKVIPRHRLNDKEPIVYYLDPGTPEPVRTALLEGARWWTEAFEAAGFKNGFQVKMLPERADPMDVRYNTIQWVHRATRGWSYGASVIDPRTGEIIKGHVTLGSLRVRHDYLLAQGLTGPFKNSVDNDTSKIKDMALARIRQLAAHEIGHTLGIAHNFAASANNRASVMDYPHPYVKIVDDKIDLSDAYSEGIGEWDKYVIKYGYQQFSSKEEETTALSELISKTRAQGLLYMSDSDARPLSGAHPSGHLWDNGKNPAAELDRVMAIRKLALAKFGLDNLAPNQPISDLEEILMPIYYFHRYQTTAAVKLIGGLEYNYAIKEPNSVSDVSPVNVEQQSQALASLLKTLHAKTLTLPTSIIDVIPPKAYGSYRNRESGPNKTGLAFDPVTLAAASANHTLSGLLQPARLARIAQQANLNSGYLTVGEYLQTIIATTVKSKASVGLESAVQQRVGALTIEILVSTLNSDKTPVEVKADLFNELSQLNSWLKQVSFDVSSGQRGYYRLLSHHLSWYFEHRKWLPLVDISKLPPGSPI